MTATILVPLAVAIAGALVYAFASNSKLARIGEIALFVGLLWTVYALSDSRLHL